MFKKILGIIDWFVPNAPLLERSELSVARNFVFTHLIGPLFSQAISIYLYRAVANPGIPFWIIMISICSFWALPFVFRATNNLRVSALLSVQLLTFTSLFGAFFYGGVSSPFLPWLLVALLLGFFYLSDRPLFVVCLFGANFLTMTTAYFAVGFPETVPIDQLAAVGWISILSATVYMSWMAVYYANVLSMRSVVERETELHGRMTEKLQEAMKLAEAANNAKSIFLAKMSHEFRTPLNAVIGYSELLIEMIEPEDRGKTNWQDLNRINSAGKHLLSLVNDVLDLSKIEADKIEIIESPFDVDGFCDQVVATATPLMKANGNSFVVQRPSRLGTIVGDETKLRQVIFNLLSNAAKFTKGGTVSFVARQRSIGVSDWIEMQVIDTGIGIAKEDLPKLFQNFQQASAMTSAKYGGTGLGLAISQKLCALMGANITVDSEVGRGTSFTVRIPVNAARITPVDIDEPYRPSPLSVALA
ncbi:Signal transduction histidine kinase [Rhizobium sp. RU20A]|uniref:sensor histidine kinase n=1 Tax=Rhizobium sp. RU20A TaxID=1907412 RepID=UPI000956B4BA|nr:ATP-binding protein [Rhizobium sp. RU20A]SIR32198.1 Signal transduction histidine kinase [Rhizobium sp. RU20A]